jgi:molybdenum cofactor cytidylyltransferase
MTAERLRVEDTALVLLAAGRSVRFGGLKLDAVVGGQPLGLHAAAALAGLPFLARVAVTGAAACDYAAAGFQVVANPDPAQGMGSSVGIGVSFADALDVRAVLIVLADMPRVTAALVGRLFDASDGPDSVVASSDGGAPRPPALFGRARFAALRALDGDAGARALLREGRVVRAREGELVDIDTREDLARLSTR